jgi:hypothetical protein
MWWESDPNQDHGGYVSGGHYNYQQWVLNDIADHIQRDLERRGKDDGYVWDVTDRTAEHMDHIAKVLALASMMVNDLDWCLSGDTGEDTLDERMSVHYKTAKDIFQALPDHAK